MNDGQARWFLAVLCAFMVTLPFLAVNFPPSVDLPQHVAQVRLFLEAIHHPAGLYKIEWFTPYSATTLLFGLIWWIAGPLATGRIGLIALGILWTGSVHGLAARRRRSPEAAVLASIVFFGFSLYWGFCTFLSGWPAFLLWFELTTRPPEKFRRRDAAALFGAALLLWVCHGLWFAVAIGWLLAQLVVFRPPWRVVAWKLGAVLPLCVGAAIWWTTLDKTPAAHQLEWFASPLSRLSPIWFSRAAFGGFRSHVELGAFLAILAWCVLSLWTNRRGFLTTADRPLLLVATLFVAGVILAPSAFSGLYWGAERFAGPSVILVLLALPAPRLRRSWLRSGAVGLLVFFCGVVAMTWRLFDETDLTGLTTAIEALPPHPRVLGLDFLRTSSLIEGRPFTHEVAYAQVLKGGRLAYSFAEGPQQLVLFKDPRKPWTRAVEYYSERVLPSDLQYFDYVLLAGDDRMQRIVSHHLLMRPVTKTGLWRLYQVRSATTPVSPQPAQALLRHPAG